MRADSSVHPSESVSVVSLARRETGLIQAEAGRGRERGNDGSKVGCFLCHPCPVWPCSRFPGCSSERDQAMSIAAGTVSLNVSPFLAFPPNRLFERPGRENGLIEALGWVGSQHSPQQQNVLGTEISDWPPSVEWTVVAVDAGVRRMALLVARSLISDIWS